ncbi:MAG: response regulator transcription factor [Roseiarcus sp.]
MEPTSILVADDDREARAAMRRGLEAEGFIVIEAEDREGVFRALETCPIKLVALGLNLGGQDGLSLAREVRATRDTPVIMIVGRDDPIDRVAGLQRGADDYIIKPFHIREVLIRVRNALARYADRNGAERTNGARRYAFDRSVFDPIKKELRSSEGSFVGLTETEIGILELFLKHPGRVLSRDDIWQLLRGHACMPLDRAVDVHIARLRRKIEPPGEEQNMIRSVRGVGYVFATKVWRS